MTCGTAQITRGVRVDTGTSLVRAGLTDFAQQSLGDVVEVPLPRIGATVTAGDACGEIESAKTADLAAPVTGTVRAHNDDTRARQHRSLRPGLDAEVDIDPATLDPQLAGLMDARAYHDLAGD